MQTERLQILASDGIPNQTCFVKMLGTIQFNHKFCLSTVKIYDISSNGILSTELNRIPPEILIP